MDGNEPILIALISALGIKEIWNIIKKKMDQSATKDAREDKLSLQVILELKEKVTNLESKINELVDENIDLKVKIARMEERMMKNAANSKKRTY
jgi:predicted RNase H-like nuclease (RuvC/YqgF family)